jgi:uncharacterized OsmC-like protein
MAKVTAKWSGQKVRFDIESGSGHTAAIDEPPLFGDDSAMRPTELLLGALGGCTGLNAVLLLKKFKQPVKTLEVEVEGEQDKEWPRAFRPWTSRAIATAPSTRRSRTERRSSITTRTHKQVDQVRTERLFSRHI